MYIWWVGKKSEAFVMVADSPMQESVDLNYAACSIYNLLSGELSVSTT